MMMKLLLCLTALLAVSVSSQSTSTWTATGMKSAIMMGIDYPDKDHIYVGAGNVVTSSTDGGNTWNDYHVPSADLIIMSMAYNSSTTGGTTGLSLFTTAQTYTTDGMTYNSCDPDGFQVDAAMDMKVVDGNPAHFASTGMFGEINGVAYSKNGMDYTRLSWQYSDSTSIARYSSFPTELTWYVAGGAWPETPSSLFMNEDGVYHRDEVTSLSQHVHISKKTGKYVQLSKTETDKRTTDTTGFIMNIQKTTDGGKTFSTVYEELDSCYFNQIECFDVITCVAAAEGDDGAFIKRTADGGLTWTNALSLPAPASIIAIKKIDNYVFAGGAYLNSQLNVTGFVYVSEDYGKNFNLESTLQGFYIQDFAFLNRNQGYATAFTTTQIGELLQYN